MVILGKWRGVLTSNRDMLYPSVVLSLAQLKIDECIEYMQKEAGELQEYWDCSFERKHLIDGLFKQCEARNRVWQSRALTGTLCDTSECVMESAAEREPILGGLIHIKTWARGLWKVDSARMKLKTLKLTHTFGFLLGSRLYTNNFLYMYTTQLLDLQTYRLETA